MDAAYAGASVGLLEWRLDCIALLLQMPSESGVGVAAGLSVCVTAWPRMHVSHLMARTVLLREPGRHTWCGTLNL